MLPGEDTSPPDRTRQKGPCRPRFVVFELLIGLGSFPALPRASLSDQTEFGNSLATRWQDLSRHRSRFDCIVEARNELNVTEELDYVGESSEGDRADH